MVDDKPMKKEKKEKKVDAEEPAAEQEAGAEKKEEATTQSDYVDDKRLFVMNLSYTVTKEELQETFGKYGEI